MNVYTSFLKGYEGWRLSAKQLIGVLGAMPISATVCLRRTPKSEESDPSDDTVSITRTSQMGYRICAGGSEHHALIDCGLNDRYVLFVGDDERIALYVNDYTFLEYVEKADTSCRETAILLRGFAREQLSDVFYDIRDRVAELKKVCDQDDVSEFCTEILGTMMKWIEEAHALAAKYEKDD